MEASTRSLSKKRKQPPSSNTNNPFTGTLTRGKVQKFFHHQNRSGSSRKCRSFPTSFTNPSLLKRKKSAKKNDISVVEDDAVDDDDEIYHISIKDLRARRVFSKPLKPKDVGEVNGGLAGKSENPRFDCGLIDGKLGGSDSKSVVENPRFDCSLIDGLGGFGAKSVVENPNLLEKCVILEGGLKEENPSFGCQKVDEKLNESNCNETLNLLEKCVDIDNGLKDGNPNLLISKTCVDSTVNCEKEVLIGENPNDSRVSCAKEGSVGETLKLSICDSRVECEKERLIGGTLNLSQCETRVDGKGESLDGAKGDCGGRVSDDLSPSLSRKGLQCISGERSEGNVQTTPPDALVLLRHSDDQSVLQNKRAESTSPPQRISRSLGGNAEGKKSFSNQRRNLGLNPCSRLKLFKATNSFSYRRMLPFLMDLTKDEPSESKSKLSIKNEIDIEAKFLVSSSQESVIDSAKSHKKPQEMNIDIKQEEEQLSLDPKTRDFSAKQAAPCTPIDCPLEKNQDSTISNDILMKPPVSNYLENGEGSPDGQVVSLMKPEDIISPITVSDLIATPVNSKTSFEPSGEDVTLNTPLHLSSTAEGECMAHSSSKSEAVLSSGGSDFGVAKGILKKNPRGCRGICKCLSCASFRLNAENAFEFSRNQWLDAEELAMDMIKELSSLRALLEKTVNGANDNAIVPVEKVQEICKRASNAEDIARHRLSQMKEDLHVHCRIKPLQRPRVTFSSSVQEKIIGVTDLAR